MGGSIRDFSHEVVLSEHFLCRVNLANLWLLHDGLKGAQRAGIQSLGRVGDPSYLLHFSIELRFRLRMVNPASANHVRSGNLATLRRG